jgi:hypothetical protein
LLTGEKGLGLEVVRSLIFGCFIIKGDSNDLGDICHWKFLLEIPIGSVFVPQGNGWAKHSLFGCQSRRMPQLWSSIANFYISAGEALQKQDLVPRSCSDFIENT